jgi:hypothetical protein
MAVELPPPLQAELLTQYDAVHDDAKLLPLPRRPNVLQVRCLLSVRMVLTRRVCGDGHDS